MVMSCFVRRAVPWRLLAAFRRSVRRLSTFVRLRSLLSEGPWAEAQVLHKCRLVFLPYFGLRSRRCWHRLPDRAARLLRVEDCWDVTPLPLWAFARLRLFCRKGTVLRFRPTRAIRIVNARLLWLVPFRFLSVLPHGLQLLVLWL